MKFDYLMLFLPQMMRHMRTRIDSPTELVHQIFVRYLLLNQICASFMNRLLSTVTADPTDLSHGGVRCHVCELG